GIEGDVHGGDVAVREAERVSQRGHGGADPTRDDAYGYPLASQRAHDVGSVREKGVDVLLPQGFHARPGWAGEREPPTVDVFQPDVPAHRCGGESGDLLAMRRGECLDPFEGREGGVAVEDDRSVAGHAIEGRDGADGGAR